MKSPAAEAPLRPSQVERDRQDFRGSLAAWVRGLAEQYERSWHTADEVVLRVNQARPPADASDAEKLRAWYRRIALNYLLDLIRRPRPDSLDEVVARGEEPRAPSSEERIGGAPARSALDSFLGQLVERFEQDKSATPRQLALFKWLYQDAVSSEEFIIRARQAYSIGKTVAYADASKVLELVRRALRASLRADDEVAELFARAGFTEQHLKEKS